MPQFEIEPSVAYFGSYLDDINVGSMLHFAYSGSTPIVTSDRINVGSFVAGNDEFLYTNLFSRFLLLSESRAGGSLVRNARIHSQGEVLFDSIVPKFDDIYTINGGKILFSIYDAAAIGNVPFQSCKYFISTYDRITASDGKVVSDAVWYRSYPFHHDYKTAQRSIGITREKFVRCTYIESGNFTIPTQSFTYFPADPTSSFFFPRTINNTSSPTFLGFTNGNNEMFSQSFLLDLSGSSSAGAFAAAFVTGLFEEEFIKNIYGFGTDTQTIIGFVTNLGNGQQQRTGRIGTTIGGWRYGLYGGFPTTNSQVVRYGRYGQLRDVLEQRLFTKALRTDTNTLIQPLLITFVSGSQAFLTASDSNTLNPRDSGIYDFEYKSGQPWQDT